VEDSNIIYYQIRNYVTHEYSKYYSYLKIKMFKWIILDASKRSEVKTI